MLAMLQKHLGSTGYSLLSQGDWKNLNVSYTVATFGGLRRGGLTLSFWSYTYHSTSMYSDIAVAASEPGVNERDNSLISRRLHYRAYNHFLLLNARNCGYAQMEDLGCAVVCRKELWLCANGKIQDVQPIKVTFNKRS